MTYNVFSGTLNLTQLQLLNLRYWFCSEFYTLSSSAKILKIGSDLTKLQRVYRWALFLRHSVAVHKWLVGDVPFYLKFWTKVTHPF